MQEIQDADYNLGPPISCAFFSKLTRRTQYMAVFNIFLILVTSFILSNFKVEIKMITYFAAIYSQKKVESIIEIRFVGQSHLEVRDL